MVRNTQCYSDSGCWHWLQQQQKDCFAPLLIFMDSQLLPFRVNWLSQCSAGNSSCPFCHSNPDLCITQGCRSHRTNTVLPYNSLFVSPLLPSRDLGPEQTLTCLSWSQAQEDTEGGSYHRGAAHTGLSFTYPSPSFHFTRQSLGYSKEGPARSGVEHQPWPRLAPTRGR